jgi:hypothetical protein
MQMVHQKRGLSPVDGGYFSSDVEGEPRRRESKSPLPAANGIDSKARGAATNGPAEASTSFQGTRAASPWSEGKMLAASSEPAVSETTPLKLKLALSSLTGGGQKNNKGKERGPENGSGIVSEERVGSTEPTFATDLPHIDHIGPRAGTTNLSQTSSRKVLAHFNHDTGNPPSSRARDVGQLPKPLRRVRSSCSGRPNESAGSQLALQPTRDMPSFARGRAGWLVPSMDESRSLTATELVVFSREDLRALSHVRRLIQSELYADQHEPLMDFLGSTVPPIPVLGYTTKSRQRESESR